MRTFIIEEPFGLEWGPERVTYSLAFERGEASANGCSVKDTLGKPVAAQLSNIDFWPDQSVKTAALSMMVSLKPHVRGTWTLSAGRQEVPQPKSDLTAASGGDQIELSNGKTGIRLAGSTMTFADNTAAEKIPPPILSVRLSNGEWIGKGWWQTDCKCIGYAAKLLDDGPVFVKAALRYDFEGGKFYSATVELNAGQDLAVVSEEFNLSEGKRYPMSGVPGMKPELQYAYVYPKFESPDKALIWDWWGQTHAQLPAPNCYYFSFGAQLKPDSADFHGSSKYGNLSFGDGGLKYDKDGRFAYINSYSQYGDEETLYLGLYNSKKPEVMLGVAGLRPSQWLHPDLDPHPDAIIKQYTQTNCLVFERQKSGDVFFRAPTCLGKRVYGIGGIARTFDRHMIPERSGPRLSERETWGADLMLRHVRMGRLRLDAVKDWVLNYDEPAKYPRLFVPEGDRVRYESRRTRKPMEEVKKRLDAQTTPTAQDKKVVADALSMVSHFVGHFAQANKGHMDYGIEEGVIADLAEDALSSPACTPEQARELRKWLAAITYYAVDPDFVPPRTAGFAWGSANMMAQVQCRACRIAALLPNHPQGKAWREQLAKVVTLYIEDQINASGVTLECPHYGSMAITMPVMGLAALASCNDVDLTRAETRLRAAAHARLALLLPWDVRGGFRSMSAEGDGYYSGDPCFAPLMGFFQNKDPQLARNLAWGLGESNNDLGEHADSAFKMVDVGLTGIEPALGSEHLNGFGFVMRNGFPRHDEACLQVVAGSFCWGHGHNDRGTWTLYAKGVPLMVDFAAMYTPSMRETWMHPGGLTFDHDETVRPASPAPAPPDDPKDSWWRNGANEQYRKSAKAPFTAVEMNMSPESAADIDRMGEVTAFKSTPQADFAVMKRRISYLHRVPYMLKETHGADLFDDSVFQEMYLKHPFIWTRRFLFVKDADPLGHNYLVIRDELPGNSELNPCLNLWCLADKVDINGQTAIYSGQHGVNVHCYVAEPAALAARTRTLGHANGFSFAGYYKKMFGKAFREDQIQVQIPQSRSDAGYFVVMVPVKQGEEAPRFETVAGGEALRVIFPDRTDTIVLATKPEGGEIDGKKVNTRSALLVKRGDKEELYELEGK
ncbi:MAG TPA: hypothetical protein VKX17_13360 [Planctomycetota bacterium]|nr:hypothetical protein [Planctomycetota bacterium]